MNRRGTRFEIDRANGKLLGVCAGLAQRTGVDATILRIGLVLFAVLITPWIFAAYVIAYFAGRQERQGAQVPARAAPVSREESRERIRNLDLRMQAIETYVTSSNSPLAREIEDLR